MEDTISVSHSKLVGPNTNDLPSVPAFVTEESYLHAASFVPTSTDIFVCSSPKCGTTWASQIVHQLRSGGDMSFNDIDDVVIWIDAAYNFGNSIDSQPIYQPRVFRSHMPYNIIPKGAKYVVVFREPCAAIYSAYRFLEGVFYTPGEMTIETFISNIYVKNLKVVFDYFEHLCSWWPKRNDSNVLILTYEGMLNDLESAVRSVATLIGITDEGSIANTVKMSSFDFMKANEEKFYTNVFVKGLKKLGYKGTVMMKRVVTGSATKGREMMSEQAKQAIQNMWNETVTSTIGFKNYEEFRNALYDESSKKFS